MTVSDNLAALRAQLPPTVTLVGVSKYQPTEAVAQAVAAGLCDFGENHAQALCQKQPHFAQCRWHFIGNLQRNKLKMLVGRTALIQSVDRLEILDALQQLCAQRNVEQDILLQVKLQEDPMRGGVCSAQLPALLAHAASCSHVHLRGLMTVAPLQGEAQAWFAQMRALFERSRRDYPMLRILSMGMTADYPAAIAQGSTMVRIGSGIFGARPSRIDTGEVPWPRT